MLGIRVQRYITSGNSAAARNYAIAWTKAEPNNDKAWGSLGDAYGVGEHQPEKAMPAFKNAGAINPYSPRNFSALGDAYLAERQFQNAAVAFEHAAEERGHRGAMAVVHGYERVRGGTAHTTRSLALMVMKHPG